MDLHRRIREHLDRLASLDQVPRTAPGLRPFITISRQAGADAHGLAEVLIGMLTEQQDPVLGGQWELYDRRIGDEMLQQNSNIPDALGEQYRSQVGEFVVGLLGAHTPQDAIYMRQSRSIRSLAMLGGMVMIGRGGNEITRDMATGVHVRLVAPLEHRVANVMQRESLGEAVARRTIQQRDQERSRLIQGHYNANIDDPLRFDAVYNTARVPLERIAASVLGLLRQRQPGT